MAADESAMICYGFKEQYDEGIQGIQILEERNYRIMRTILEKDYQGASNYTAVQARRHLGKRQVSVDEQNFRLIKTSYDSCMDIESITQAGVTPLVSLLDDLNTIWPFTGGNLTSPATGDEDWASFSKAVLFLEKIDVHTVAKIYTGRDLVEPNNTVISIEPTKFSLDSYGEKDTVGNCTAAIAQALLGVGLPGNFTQDEATSIASGIAGLEASLTQQRLALLQRLQQGQAPGLEDGLELNPDGSISIAFEKVANSAPGLGLDTVVKGLVPSDYQLLNVTLSQATPGLFANTSAIISDTPKSVLQSWLAWRVIAARASIVESDSLAAWKKIGVHEVKVLATQKVKNMKRYIAYPSSPALDIKSPESLAKFYAGRNASADYFATTMSFHRWDVARKFGQLGKPINGEELDDGSTVMTVGANFEQLGNNIHIMAGIMELPSFSYDLPSYANFGGMGAVLGHEMVHGFDNTGRNFNPDGALATWWDNSTIKEFESRNECFVKQYSSYTIEGPHGLANVSGTLTLGENIADAGGLRAAYDTWKKLRADGKSNDWTIPGLEDFTPEQLFFILYGNMWCSSETPAQVDLANAHSPGPIRLVGGVDNSAAFGEAFSCPSKKPTCELW
ncbi:hypothetical protein B0T22DRAFT_477190 [Podospora appendiculata]|uniref:Uncharacterized protein n=1 Tax=Podospora appendiculata TaxID=314037 RepID=A0AAE0XJI5_9PEZI|nr:hypothetical protein B0T22DRAFT_477190 [Podospora appendiculata]